MRREPGTGRKKLLRQLEDAQQGPVVGCLGPTGIINYIAFLLIEERSERPAGKNVVEAGVDLLIFPVVSPYMTTGICVMERFEIAR